MYNIIIKKLARGGFRESFKFVAVSQQNKEKPSNAANEFNAAVQRASTDNSLYQQN